ncbi:MAG: glycine cleavage system protein GcvH [Alphaproteobacteria bacterium]|nr:glycine cleavage system protein GcvH [Alphaproteobacteria bacterium]
MSEVRYSEEHEWISVDGDVGTIGITDYAQQQLGDVVYVELPEVGRTVEKDGDMATIESVKAASEIFAPVSGEVVKVNSALDDDPATVNSDAEGQGWMVKLRIADAGQLEGLMDAAAYKKFVEGLD